MKYAPHVAVAALSAVFACAAPPATYERGTLTRPPPAPHRPGVGAPTYDPQVKPLPPQPQPKPQRVLPQTPETARQPGIWASDAPPATKAEPVTLLDITIPTPPEATEEAVSVARMCSYWYADGLINNAEHARRVMALTKEQRLCLVVDVMNVCLRIAFNPDISSADEAKNTRKVLAHMNDTTKKTCRAHKDTIRDLASSIIAATSNRWNKLPQGPLQ